MFERPLPTAPKALWRQWALEMRQTIEPNSAAVTAHLREFLHAQGIRRVLAYHHLAGEPELAALHREFELFTTRTRYKPERHLTLHAWDTATEISKFGYRQPPTQAPRVALDSIEAVLLPGLAYDLRGVRLGYGGGFYDRLLPNYAGITIGVVWSPLLVPELPGEAHDIRVAWVATELGIQPCRQT